MRPDRNSLIRHLVGPVEHAEGHMTLPEDGRINRAQPRRRGKYRDQARKVIDLLGKQMANVFGDSDGVGKQIVDGRKTGAGRMPPRGHLDGSGLAREYREPVSRGVAGQIDQDVDLVRPYLTGQPIVGPLRGVPPRIRNPLEVLREAVLGGRARIANDLEPRLVVVFEHGLEAEGRGVYPEVGRDVSQNNAPRRIATVAVMRLRSCRNIRANLPPPMLARFLLFLEADIRCGIEDKYLIRNSLRIIGP